jgi:hypothetical protein
VLVADGLDAGTRVLDELATAGGIAAYQGRHVLHAHVEHLAQKESNTRVRRQLIQ